METLWPFVSLALFVALSVAALAAPHIKPNMMTPRTNNATATLNASRAKNSYTTTPTENKPSGLETQQPPATYAVYPSSQETLSKQIMSMQETQTVNSNLHIKDATPVGVPAPSPNQHNNTQPTHATHNHKH